MKTVHNNNNAHHSLGMTFAVVLLHPLPQVLLVLLLLLLSSPPFSERIILNMATKTQPILLYESMYLRDRFRCL